MTAEKADGAPSHPVPSASLFLAASNAWAFIFKLLVETKVTFQLSIDLLKAFRLSNWIRMANHIAAIPKTQLSWILAKSNSPNVIASEIIVLQALRHTIGNTAFLLKSQGKQPKQPVKTYPVLEQFAMQGRTVGGRSLVCVCPRPSPRPAPSPAVYHFATSQSCNRGRCVL